MMASAIDMLHRKAMMRRCEVCNEWFEIQRSTGRICSAACKTRKAIEAKVGKRETKIAKGEAEIAILDAKIAAHEAEIATIDAELATIAKEEGK